ncbi:MAG TPA: hypothetical protein VE057_01770 [Archangium sp.]|nr:hypothetical protein [Archangium sp.]
MPSPASAPRAHDTAPSLPAFALHSTTIAFLASSAQQFLHEALHGLVALLVGARWEKWWFQATQWSPPGAEELSPLRVGLIKGTPALVNILCAFACMALLARRRSPWPPNLRLLVFYFGAYSLFSGFGYLMVDPLFAGPKSVGDWARVVMLLGGSWAVRLPIILVGAAGVTYGFFWMGNQALRFSVGDAAGRTQHLRLGLALCIIPYLAVNALSTLIFLTSPLSPGVFWASVLKYWFGYIGFFWAYMIKFVWKKFEGPAPGAVQLSARLDTAWLVAALAVLLVDLFLLAPGITIQQAPPG